MRVEYTPVMIDVKQMDDEYRVGRDKPGGKVYVMGLNDARIASYSGVTETLEWYATVSPEAATLIEKYLKENY
jgi:hypothetical protein